SPHRRQLRRGVQDGGATGLAFGGAGLVPAPAGFFLRGSVHDLTIARTVVIIKRGKSTNGRFLPGPPCPPDVRAGRLLRAVPTLPASEGGGRRRCALTLPNGVPSWSAGS